jgi:hypothetical protein
VPVISAYLKPQLSLHCLPGRHYFYPIYLFLLHLFYQKLSHLFFVPLSCCLSSPWYSELHKARTCQGSFPRLCNAAGHILEIQNSHFILFFCGTGIWTQGIVLASRCSTAWTTPPVLFALIIWDRVSLFAQGSLNSEPPLGWQASNITLIFFLLRWGSHNFFLPSLALNRYPPDFSLPSS